MVLLVCTLRGMHACNLHCSPTCGGTSKQTNAHLTLAVMELNPTEFPPMLRPKTSLFQVGREKNKDFLSLLFEKKKKTGIFCPCFLGKIPAFWRKNGDFVFLPFKNRAILAFLLFSLLFSPLSTFFLANPAFFSQKSRERRIRVRPFSRTRAARVLLCFSCLCCFSPFRFVLRLHTFSRSPSRLSSRSGQPE